jgi:hypothetical protein
MTLENYTRIILSGLSILIGTILGILRSKIFSSKNKNRLYYYFYSLCILILIVISFCLIQTWHKLFYPPNWFSIIIIAVAIGFIILLFFITKKFLIIKDIFHTSELDPIVNSFTAKADRSKIKLFGGDLNFLGNTPEEINGNLQYSKLREMNFRRVMIICEAPVNPTQAIRYGKILSEISGVELRFYNPEKANLQVRGRMIKLNGSVRLLMYKRIESKVYKPIETDTSDSDGALYNNIWDLVWELATTPTSHEIDSYINSFKGNHQ